MGNPNPPPYRPGDCTSYLGFCCLVSILVADGIMAKTTLFIIGLILLGISKRKVDIKK